MTYRKMLNSMIKNLRETTSVLENSEDLKLSDIKNGILIVCSEWSMSSISNCRQTIALLYEKKYSGEIIIMNSDMMTIDFQLKEFGQLNHGWGEIFKIHNGEIVNKYLDKDSFSNFKNEFD